MLTELKKIKELDKKLKYPEKYIDNIEDKIVYGVSKKLNEKGISNREGKQIVDNLRDKFTKEKQNWIEKLLNKIL